MAQLDYLVTGATGQLGRAVVALAKQRAASVLGFSGKDLPLDSRARIQQVLLEHRPKNVIHCAAVTNVDGCEGDPLLAYRVNGLGTAWLAEAAAAIAGKLVYVSTDFVFDGTKQGVPYEVDARVSPLSVYGASKRLGEEAVLSYDRAKIMWSAPAGCLGRGQELPACHHRSRPVRATAQGCHRSDRQALHDL